MPKDQWTIASTLALSKMPFDAEVQGLATPGGSRMLKQQSNTRLEVQVPEARHVCSDRTFKAHVPSGSIFTALMTNPLKF